MAASALLGVVTLLGSPVAARAQRAADLSLPMVTRVAVLAAGEPGALAGIVRSEEGEPIGGAVVSALGATTSFAVTDALGRYEITTLNPGPYFCAPIRTATLPHARRWWRFARTSAWRPSSR